MSKTRGSIVRTQRLAPRNPVAVAARQRAAGAHGPTRKAQRNAARRALQRALATEDTDTALFT